MKLYDSIGPNPHVVRMFLAEKGVDVPTETVDLMAGDNRRDDHLARNPQGGLPCLELDDGTFLSEITAICEYLEELHPTPPLIGTTPEERAETRMWARRIDLYILEPLTNGFRWSEGLPLFQERVTCLPEAADGLKRLAAEKLVWLDGLLEGRDFVCGDRLTLADILLYCFVQFGATVGQPLPESCTRVRALCDRLGERDSAAA